jgi:hypothetical protein
MSTHGAANTPGIADRDIEGTRRRSERFRVARTETKPAFKTTELLAYIAVLAGILIAAAIEDGFGSSTAWQYATILTAGYMISRGLAKSGSHEPRDDHDH